MSVRCTFSTTSLKCTPAGGCDAIDGASPTYATYNISAIIITISK